MIEILFWSVGALFVYSTVGYPLLVFRLARRRGRRLLQAAPRLPVTLYVAARNEAAHINARLKNARALSWPSLRIVIVSDGSRDETAAIARKHEVDPRVAVVELPEPVGKSAALAAAVRREDRAGHARPEGILAFSDATAVWPEDALERLLAPFADPDVGCVSGLVVYDYPAARVARGFSAYQRVEIPLRRAESALGCLTSVSGSISAIRAGLFEPTSPELSYDLVHPWRTARAGRRTVLASLALSVEVARGRSAAEWRSRVRLALSGFSFAATVLRGSAPSPWGFRWAFGSHKLLRWLLPAQLTAILGLGLALWPGPAAVLLLLGGLSLFSGPGLFAGVVGGAYLVGLGRFLFGARVHGWDPDSQR